MSHKPADHILDEFLAAHGVKVPLPEFGRLLGSLRVAIEAEAVSDGVFTMLAVPPRPVIDREALKAVVRKEVYGEFGTFSGPVDHITDAVMELARPMPTQEQIAEALHNNDHAHQWREHGVCHRFACDQIYPPMADVVLALLNGSES